MVRIAGVPNKITSEVKDKLQLLIDDLIASLPQEMFEEEIATAKEETNK